MPRGRGKLKIQWIIEKASRKAAFRKRRATLLAKAKELSTLCKVPVAVVVYGPGSSSTTTTTTTSPAAGDGEPPAFYPEDIDEARGIMRRYMELPEAERAAHTLDNEGVRRQSLKKLEKRLEACRAANRRLEASLVINDIGLGRRTGLDGLDPDLAAAVTAEVDLLRAAVSARIRALTSGSGGGAAAGDAPAKSVLVSSEEKPLMVTPLATMAPPPPPPVVVAADAGAGGGGGVNEEEEDEFPRNGSYLLEVADAIMDNGGDGSGGGAVEATGEDVGRLLKENGLESFVKPKPKPM